MPKHAEVRELPYSADHLFGIVADVERYPEFLPWCSAAKVIETTENQLRAELTISYKGFSGSYISRVTLSPPPTTGSEARIDVGLDSGQFKRLKCYWLFHPLSENRTRLEFFVDFELQSRILEKAVVLVFGKAVKKIINAFETRARAFSRKVCAVF